MGGEKASAFQSRQQWNKHWAASVSLEVKSLPSGSFAGTAKTSGEVSGAIDKGQSVTRVLQQVGLYRIELDRDFPLSSALSDAAEHLSQSLDHGNFDEDMESFFHDWGTHYQSSVEIGGYVEQFVATASCKNDHSLKTEAEVEAEAKRRVSRVLQIGGSGSVSGGYSNSDSFRGSSSSKDYYVYGGDASVLEDRGYSAWKDTLLYSEPGSLSKVSFKLEPIWDRLGKWPRLKKRMKSFYYETYLGNTASSQESAEELPSCSKPTEQPTRKPDKCSNCWFFARFRPCCQR